ncbi:hypothetical protein K0M31_018639 [Melipona bicolor]|uniref:Uncharacterized protein n=1 Tax=Melipona bicolor TaxID=60889 RepID=A0AA40KS42_9HYME|nr:hypothetical protein K0M31_018639 [Melipona bicolor]
MNDEIKLEMNDCQSLQKGRSFSKTRLDDYTCNTEFRYGYTLEPATQFATCNSKLKPRNDVHNFLDKFQMTACESIDQYEEKWSGQDLLNGTRFEIVNEKNLQDSRTGNQFTSNWIECRRILSNFQRQLNNLKIRTGNQEFFGNLLFSKYKKYDETRMLQENSLSCNTLSSLTPEKNSNELTSKRHFVDETDKIDNNINNIRDYREIENKMTRIRTRSITSCSGSPPPAKKCRTMLKFDDEEDVEGPQESVASFTTVDLLPAEEKNVQNYFCPNTMITKTSWSAGSSESNTSTLNLPAVSNSDSYSACLKESIGNSFQMNKSFRRLQSVKKPVAKIVLFCVWIIKKVTAVLKESYGNLRRAASTSMNRQMEELSQVVITLRSENEQMINTLLEKVTRLSEQITQVRVSNTTAIDVLTAEISGMRDVTKKLTENNETLMQELQRLQQSLENMRSKSPKKLSPPSLPISLSSNSSAVPPPPPPPPPPPLPPLFPLAPSLLSMQSPAQLITPTTPNSSGSRNVRTPSRKCSTPLFNRPAITVEDLLKVTLKKAPRNVKENRRNTIPGPKGPVVSLDMLRSVKLKSARRRTTDQITRSPRSGRILKTRTAPSLSLSPIMKSTDNSLGRILKQADVNKRPRCLLSSSSFRENIIGRDNQSQNIEDNGSQSMIA